MRQYTGDWPGLTASQTARLLEKELSFQQRRSLTLSYISSSFGCAYTTVVSGDACLANLCARNRSLDAQYTLVTATPRRISSPARTHRER